MHLLVPTRSPAYFAANPSKPLLTDTSAKTPSAVSKILGKAAAEHIHYLTSLTCAQGHAGQPIPKPATHGTSTIDSGNWSGYVSQSTNQNYLGAEMEWTVPAVKAPPSPSAVVSSIWPGIGPGTSAADTLVQAGTEQDGNCIFSCVDSYYFWQEMYPQVSQEEITNLAVSPGNDVAALVEYNPATNQACFELDNFTTDLGVSDYQDLTGFDPGTGSQAEWIVERTGEGCSPTGALQCRNTCRRVQAASPWGERKRTCRSRPVASCGTLQASARSTQPARVTSAMAYSSLPPVR